LMKSDKKFKEIMIFKISKLKYKKRFRIRISNKKLIIKIRIILK
jgi:hypothetical protein